MKKINFVKDILPHLIAVFTFLIVTFFFFSPVFLDNKSINQPDIQMWEGSSKALRDFRDKTGEEGLWVQSMFSGMPAYLVNVEWSNGPVLFFKKVLSLWLPHPIANIFVGFISYYILLLSFRIRPYLAIAGALAFGLSSYLIIGLAAGHNARIGAIAFMPLVVAGIHLTVSGKRMLGFGITALGMALHLRENHLQITYYMMMIVGVYGLVQLINFYRAGKIIYFAKSLALLVPAVLLGLGTFLGPFWAITEYSRYSMRGPSELVKPDGESGDTGLDKSYAFQHSNGIWEPMTLMIPNFYGGSSMNLIVNDQESNTYKALMQSGNEQLANQIAPYARAYWGPQSLAAPYYAGAIICFLFVLGVVYAEKKYVWWLLSLSIFSIMLTWGDNFSSFNYFMFDYFPGYDKFRSVTFALVIILFAMPLLGMLGLENLLSTGWKEKSSIKKLTWPLGITLGVCFVLAISGGFGDFLSPYDSELPPWFTNALKADRIDLFRSDAWRSFWFIAVFAVLLYARLKNWIKDPIFVLLSVLLVTLDISFVDKRYLNYQRARQQSAFVPYAADQEILRDKSYYRVYNIQDPFNEARNSYFHNSIGGYHGAKIRRYQDLYDSCLFRQTQQLIQDVQGGDLDFARYGAINMLNVKYLVYGPDQNNIIPNPEANGSAWFVNEIVAVNSPTEELEKICEVNTKTQAVIDVSKFNSPSISYDSTASITLRESSPNHMTYESQSATNGLAVFSEIFYPKGWTATIDGTEVPILRADYVLRALAVPEGKHVIEFMFRPTAYVIGNKITSASSWLLLVVVLGCVGWTLKEEKS